MATEITRVILDHVRGDSSGIDMTALARDGSRSVLGNIDVNGYRLTNAGDPVGDHDYTTKSWVLNVVNDATGLVTNLKPGIVNAVGPVNSLLRSTGNSAVWSAMNAEMHGNLSGGALHAVATEDSNGFMSSAMVSKLAGIAALAAALGTSAPTNITRSNAVVGSSQFASPIDHKHDVAVGTPQSLAPGGSNSVGTGAALALASHIHALPEFGSSAGTFAQGNDPRFATVNGASIQVGSGLTTGHVLQVTGPSSLGYGFVSNANVAPDAAIEVTKLATGGAYQFLIGGASNSWSAMTDNLHGARGGGGLHAAVTNLYAGFSPAISGGNRVLASTSGSSATWVSITDSLISSVAWGKLTGTPTTLAGYGITNGVSTSRIIATTAPLAGGGSLSSDLTLSVANLSNITAGVPPAISAADRVLLSTNGTSSTWGQVADAQISGVNWSKVAGTPTTLSGYGITNAIDGSGTAGYLPKFSDANTLANSVLYESSGKIGIGTTTPDSPLHVQGNSGNTAIHIVDTNNANASWYLIAGAQESGDSIFYMLRGSTIAFCAKHTGLVGFGGIIDPSSAVDTPTLRIRTGAAAGKFLQSDSNGTATWSNQLTSLQKILFAETASVVQISQADHAGGNAASLEIMAQNAVGGGNLFGGNLILRGGAGDNSLSGMVVAGLGITQILGNGAARLAEFGNDMMRLHVPLWFYAGATSPIISQETYAGAAHGQSLTLKAQSVTTASIRNGGTLYLYGGDGTGYGGDVVIGSGSGSSYGSGTVTLTSGVGILLQAVPNTGLRVRATGGKAGLHIANSNSAGPTLLENGCLFVYNGALWYRGSSGTSTQVAPA